MIGIKSGLLSFSLRSARRVSFGLHVQTGTPRAKSISTKGSSEDKVQPRVIVPTATVNMATTLTQPLLLVSDLDDTMTYHSELDHATHQFKQLWDHARGRMDCKLVFNTGRTLPLYEELRALKAHCLAEPDVLICGVGTRIYHRTEAGWQEDAHWSSVVMQQAWDAARVRAIMDDLLAQAGPDRLRYQRAVECHDHKLTVVYSGEVREGLLAALRDRLAAAGLAATFIHGPVASLNGYFLDLVPQGAGKGAALEYIRQAYNWPHGLTVACGDSANDLLMFDAAPNVIVVGNSSDEAREWVARHRQMGQQGHAAMAGKRVYAAQQPAAAGIIEGLRGLGFVS